MVEPGTHDAVAEERARRRDGPGGDEGRAAEPGETATEIVVLHDVQAAVSPERPEYVATDEDGLVSIEGAGRARP